MKEKRMRKDCVAGERGLLQRMRRNGATTGRCPSARAAPQKAHRQIRATLEPLGVHSREKYLNIADAQYDAPCSSYYTNSALVIPTITIVNPVYREGKAGKQRLKSQG